MSRRAPSIRTSSLALVLALVYGLGQLAALEHLAAVTHVTCAEHGEALHLDSPEGLDPLAATEAAPGLRQSSDRPTALPEHEHCPVLSHVQPREAFLASPSTSCVPSTAAAPLAPVGTDAPHGLAPATRAPKHSPPLPAC